MLRATTWAISTTGHPPTMLRQHPLALAVLAAALAALHLREQHFANVYATAAVA